MPKVKKIGMFTEQKDAVKRVINIGMARASVTGTELGEKNIINKNTLSKRKQNGGSSCGGWTGSCISQMRKSWRCSGEKFRKLHGGTVQWTYKTRQGSPVRWDASWDAWQQIRGWCSLPECYAEYQWFCWLLPVQKDKEGQANAGF